jgi:hypothetical protein
MTLRVHPGRDEETRASLDKEPGDNIGKGKTFVEELDAQVVEHYKNFVVTLTIKRQYIPPALERLRT